VRDLEVEELRLRAEAATPPPGLVVRERIAVLDEYQRVRREFLVAAERLVAFNRQFPQAFLNGEAERRQWQTGVPVAEQLPPHLGGALPIKADELGLGATQDIVTGLTMAHLFPSSDFLRREAGI
jgi:hypothetical protein